MSFTLRPAEPEDAPELLKLATSLSARGFLTLPDDKKGLAERISTSQKSFLGRISDPDEGFYLFVCEDKAKGRLVGCSLILARHGTPESPHVYFEILDVQKASPKLKKLFKHQILRLRLDAEGSTELGGLIVDPAYRGHPDRLGKHLSFVRFLYIHQHPERFRTRLLVELLPPLTSDGRSPFWESLGRKFTGLDYLEADRLSREDKEFITSLFPEGDIYTAFLSEEARRVIGEVGPETRPVAHMLEEIGFRYLTQIDPFDGGPHYGAQRDSLKMEIVKEFFRQSPLELNLPT